MLICLEKNKQFGNLFSWGSGDSGIVSSALEWNGKECDEIPCEAVWMAS